jgi:hypothetical protein
LADKRYGYARNPVSWQLLVAGFELLENPFAALGMRWQSR